MPFWNLGFHFKSSTSHGFFIHEETCTILKCFHLAHHKVNRVCIHVILRHFVQNPSTGPPATCCKTLRIIHGNVWCFVRHSVKHCYRILPQFHRSLIYYFNADMSILIERWFMYTSPGLNELGKHTFVEMTVVMRIIHDVTHVKSLWKYIIRYFPMMFFSYIIT